MFNEHPIRQIKLQTGNIQVSNFIVFKFTRPPIAIPFDSKLINSYIIN